MDYDFFFIDFILDRCDVTILPGESPTRADLLQAIPGHDAVFLSSHSNVNAELLDIAGKEMKN